MPTPAGSDQEEDPRSPPSSIHSPESLDQTVIAANADATLAAADQTLRTADPQLRNRAERSPEAQIPPPRHSSTPAHLAGPAADVTPTPSPTGSRSPQSEGQPQEEGRDPPDPPTADPAPERLPSGASADGILSDDLLLDLAAGLPPEPSTASTSGDAAMALAMHNAELAREGRPPFPLAQVTTRSGRTTHPPARYQPGSEPPEGTSKSKK